MNINKEQ